MLRAPNVSAQTLGGVSVGGTCPTQAQVVTALAARALPDAARGYRLTVRSGHGYAEFVLGDGDGRALLDRFVASDDCAAIADVVALVTEAFFVELIDKGHPPDDTSAIVSARPAPAPAAASEARAAAEERRTPPHAAAESAPNAPDTSGTAPPHAIAVEKPAAVVAPPHAAAERSRHNLVLTLGVGADAYAAPTAVAPFGQLGAALYFGAPRLSLELHAVAEAAATLRSAPDRVLRSEARVAMRVARYFGGAAQLVPWLGFGAARSRSRALDLDGPVRHLTAPLVEGGIVVRAARTAWLTVGAELGCHALLTRERYVVVPDGNIGDGPAFGCQLGPNLSWSSPEF